MRNIVPLTHIQNRLGKPLRVTEKTFAELNDIIELDPHDVVGTAMNVWNRIVQYRLKPVNPQAMAPYIQSPRLFERISQHIGEPILKDGYLVHGFVDDPALQDEEFVDVTLFKVFPNNLHVADVFFQNRYARLPAEQRRGEHQHFRGFGALPLFMENAKAYARQQGLDFITLTAASADLIPLFGRYGFTVESNSAARFCVQTGMCIPMEWKVS